MTFTGRIGVDGDGKHRVVLSKWDTAALTAWLAKKPVDTAIDVTVAKKRKQRTSPQNRYLHGVAFPLLVVELDYSMSPSDQSAIAELKRDLLGTCFGWKRSPLGHEVPVIPHTSELSDDQAGLLIDWLGPFAAERGIYLPEPCKEAA